jgi:hypothetical protein
MIKDPKALIAVAVVAILVIAGVAVVVSNNNNGGNKSHDNLADMTWDEIVEKAKGTDVAIAFYFDQPCMNWFNDVMVKQAKELYDINLTCVGYKTATLAVNEYSTSGKISYDFLWGRASDYAKLVNYDGKGGNMLLQSDWESKMPNMKYSDGLADASWKATYESMYGEGTYSRNISSVAPFSGSTTSFVYNTAFNDPEIEWNEVKITDLKATVTKTITVTEESTGVALDKSTAVASIDDSKTYSISSVREYRVANQDASALVYYGLPHNYTELYDWSKVYPEQFYLPSATGNANFHVQLILEAMIYELAADGDSWIACTDKDADVWSGDLKGKYTGDYAKDKATYMEYVNEKILKNGTTPEKYGEQVPYLKAYLEDAAPYWNKALTGTSAAVTAPNQTLVGNKDTTQKDFSSSTIMIALNSTESLANRTYMYAADIGVYAPETTCSNRCGLFLMENSPNPYGAIVVANLFNDPANQASYYSIAGNGYNVDLNTLSAEQKQLFESRWTDWDAYDKPYVSPEAIQSNMVMPAIGYLEGNLSQYADKYIKASA